MLNGRILWSLSDDEQRALRKTSVSTVLRPVSQAMVHVPGGRG